MALEPPFMLQKDFFFTTGPKNSVAKRQKEALQMIPKKIINKLYIINCETGQDSTPLSLTMRAE